MLVSYVKSSLHFKTRIFKLQAAFIYIFYKHTIQVSLSIFYSYNNDDNNNDNKKLDQNGKVHDY